MRKRIRAFFPKGDIPGVDAASDGLVSSRVAPGVMAERMRAARRAGASTGGERSQDAAVRAHGVPIFDRRAGLSELGGYLARARGR